MDTAYRSPSLADSQASTMMGGDHDSDTDLLKPRRFSSEPHEAPVKVSGPKTIIVQLFALAWVAPILLLLFLNVKTHILGASAWCTFNTCFPQVYSDDTSIPLALPTKFDKETHNFLGALQLVAKCLEIWFILICTWLVYLITIKLAQKREGLPIGYISRPSEFAEIPSLFDKLLWTTLRHSSVRRRYPSAKGRLWIFIIATVLLCALCNLMGPAVAVLVIPSLQWIDTEDIVTDRFISFNSANPPGTDGFAFDDASCISTSAAQNFTDRQYSCSAIWANSLDSWVESTFARQGTVTAVPSLQDIVSFSYNATWVATSNATFPNGTYQTNRTYDTINWAPSRQLLQELSDDLRIVQNVSQGLEVLDPRGKNAGATYYPYNSTVQTLLRRSGPVWGAIVNTWIGFNTSTVEAAHFSIVLDDTRTVRCYQNYNLFNTPNCWGACVSATNRKYTRCITMGTGWNDGYKAAGFLINGRHNAEYMGPPANFWHLASGHAAFLPNGTIPQNVLDAGFSEGCLNQATVNSSNCNWDAFFNLTAEDPWIKPRSKKVNTLQIHWDPKDVPGKSSLITLAVDFVAFSSFAEYVLDPSWMTNSWNQVEHRTRNIPAGQLYELIPTEVDPAWTLAAWSVNDVDGFKLDSTRSAPSRLQKLADRFYNSDDTTWQDYNLFAERFWLNAIALMPIMQTLR